ncbi:uncharacterized protein Z519_10335 [Cladophialophora bantiana CBS 173.52]|uniref:Uncharacterized protein n=1 Tax=Cladophialophora bantiana (strain ATCC 10958 / CBS 173.52 / CDC B-1940 / NIH 8579) TaxID=1442370 RepID=A0A0D2EFK8_CLAB1|nr:uncharacterized protein Z519_10335 [Cladophialophora bantiana CBS 173.52]KIW88851.1 hypothetical protein Z519_10335 [Cladophialophora bantiana CBS 173.52]
MDSKYGDLRRKRNTVQHVEQLRQQQAILDRLLELIRNSEADEAIQAVREGATFEEIVNVLLRPPSGAAPSQTAGSSSSDTSREESSLQATPDKPDSSGSDRPASTRFAKESDETTEYAVRVRRGNPDQGTSHPAPGPKERAMVPSLAGPKSPSGIGQEQQTCRNRVWTGLAKRLTAVELSKINMPIFSCDPYHTESDDMLSKTILSFRDGARKALQGNANVHDLIGSKKPDLDLFFRQRREGDTHSAWTWACELAKAYPLPLTVQLTGVFVAGIQMRYFIHPCKETYDDLPVMLRPTRQQYTQPHAAGADICAIPPIKQYLLSHWDSYASLLEAGQYHNWPYSNQACLGWDRTRNKPTLSTAFLEHILDPKNHSVGAKILELVPEAAPYVVREEESPRPEDAH